MVGVWTLLEALLLHPNAGTTAIDADWMANCRTPWSPANVRSCICIDRHVSTLIVQSRGQIRTTRPRRACRRCRRGPGQDCVDRLAGDGSHTIAEEMDEVAVKGLHRVEVRNSNGDPDEAVLEIRYRRIRVLPPIGKQKRYPALTLTVIHAEERGTPKNRKKVEWKLITDLPVASRADAIEKLEWYALRWKI